MEPLHGRVAPHLLLVVRRATPEGKNEVLGMLVDEEERWMRGYPPLGTGWVWDTLQQDLVCSAEGSLMWSHHTSFMSLFKYLQVVSTLFSLPIPRLYIP